MSEVQYLDNRGLYTKAFTNSSSIKFPNLFDRKVADLHSSLKEVPDLISSDEAGQIPQYVNKGLNVILLCYHGLERSDSGVNLLRNGTDELPPIVASRFLGGVQGLSLLRQPGPVFSAISSVPNVCVLSHPTELSFSQKQIIGRLKEMTIKNGHNFFLGMEYHTIFEILHRRITAFPSSFPSRES